MEDSEKTNDSMLLEEAMEETEKSTQETNATEEDNAEDGADDGMGMVQDSELVGGVLDNEDIEMADGVAEDSENNNLAPEDSMDAAAAILEGEDGSGEVSQEALSTPEGFLGDQFISPADSMIVQSEPPQQLMEEADAPGEDEDDIALENEGETEGDEVIKSEADTTDEPSSKTEDGEQSEGVEEDMSMQETEGEAGELKEQDESSTVGLGTLSDGMSLEMLPDQEDHEAGDDSQEEKDADKTTCDLAGNTDDTIQLHLDESEEGDENEGTGETGGITLLAGEDQLEGALSELEGKIAAASEKGVHLLAGQENLQGMQLMEGDDKPEGEIDATETAAQQEIQAQLNAALLKQEEMKTEDDSDSGAFSESQPNTVSDALSTLASAALDHQAPPTNGVKSEIDESQIKTETDSTEPQWMDVGICKGTHCQVRSFFIPKSGQSWDQNWEGITTSTLPDHRGLAKLELESGKAYKFRVAAINSCGRGPWSEVAAFKTSLPGFPGAPSAIKIAKTADGAHLSWEPPPITSGVIEDYHVYLAVRTATTTDTSRVVSSSANQLAFVRIYQGAANQCSVGNETLGKAHIDMTTKPAILFRISARNEKGIGPATQVRWLQEVGAPNNAARPAQAPRRPATENKPHGNYKRKKSESQ